MTTEREHGPDPESTHDTTLDAPRSEHSFGTDKGAEELFPYVHGEPGRLVTDTLLWHGPDTVEGFAGFFRNHTIRTFVSHRFRWLLSDHTAEITGRKDHR